MWGAAITDFLPEVLERALAHEYKNKVEATYQRDNILEKRRYVMEAWGRYCGSSNVVPFNQSVELVG